MTEISNGTTLQDVIGEKDRELDDLHKALTEFGEWQKEWRIELARLRQENAEFERIAHERNDEIAHLREALGDLER